jgi:hypothetical protein
VPRVVVALTASLLGLCLVSSQADARELTRGERSYSRTLGKLLRLKPKGTKALTSKTGARGVKVRFLGLDVTRLHFRSAQAAARFAKRRSREKSGRQRVALRGQEILVLRGPRLSNAAFSERAVKAGWDASVRSPSKPTKDGLLGPLDAKEAREKAAEAKQRLGGLASKPKDPSASKGKDSVAPPIPPQAPETKVAQDLTLPRLPGAQLPSVGQGPRSGPRKVAPAPRGIDLAGYWQTLGPGRIYFRRTGQTKTSDVYEVICVDFDRPCPPLIGSFSGRRLTLRPASGKGRQVEYLWVPGKASGGRFAFLSGSRQQLPAGTGAFWRATK